MQIINKITKRDVTREYIGLIKGLITGKEFVEVTCSSGIKKQTNKEIK